MSKYVWAGHNKRLFKMVATQNRRTMTMTMIRIATAKQKFNLINKKQKYFYVCSYGGCGSKMLCRALQKFGVVRHIHSRNPPNQLEYVGHDKGGNCYREWFNGIKIPKDKVKQYYVIYIYRNPVKSILSRFGGPHLTHIQVNKNIKLSDVIERSKDLYKINEFYNNYTKPNNKRNYKIYSVKYEEIFNKQNYLSKVLGIGRFKFN